ncbi:GH25 family lysozyme [Lentilactobacillus sp. Marseille-Q4993]|uniref:GH25 family lysozyme n=1 Tax=Lentilactobacillus sp. Marseille-Q4993 TaxID=3039492 RepID=UPI0024BC5B5C|nr:GH25 family lysozyme [Lentilactobacillus sp. Marseille-Q4993]
MSSKVIDVSSYQSDTVSYFKKVYNAGARGMMVKLTEGLNYLNPKAGSQIVNGLKVFKSVGVYHYFLGNGQAEAQYFLAHIKTMGLTKDTVLGIDVEDPSLPYYNTAQVNVFLKYLRDHGYTHLVTYGSGSWFNSGRINRSHLIDKHIWVAAYGVSQPGVNNANAWQYTDNLFGADCSYDFDGTLTGNNVKTKAEMPKYYNTPGLYEVTAKMIHAYRDKKFKVKRYVRWEKGSRFYGTPVKYGKITRLKTELGYVTSNTSKVKLVKEVQR